MNAPHQCSAEYRLVFDGTKPVVTARHGIVSGHRARLSALRITVTALTQPDGTVGISTHLDPEFAGWVYNPDQHAPIMQNLITLDADQLPAQAKEWHTLLVSAVNALHPGLRYTKAAS